MTGAAGVAVKRRMSESHVDRTASAITGLQAAADRTPSTIQNVSVPKRTSVASPEVNRRL